MNVVMAWQEITHNLHFHLLANSLSPSKPASLGSGMVYSSPSSIFKLGPGSTLSSLRLRCCRTRSLHRLKSSVCATPSSWSVRRCSWSGVRPLNSRNSSIVVEVMLGERERALGMLKLRAWSEKENYDTRWRVVHDGTFIVRLLSYKVGKLSQSRA